MKELESVMKEDLSEVLRIYVVEGITPRLKKYAKTVESRYLNSSPLVSEQFQEILGKLTYFYADIDPGPISKEEAKEIISILKSS